jgi:stearoyl-CoA desaturase (delta-9 desaturase)
MGPMSATKAVNQPNWRQPQSGKKVTYTRWFERVHWENVFWVIIFPLFGLVAAAFTPLQTKTAILMVIYHFTTGLGITAG